MINSDQIKKKLNTSIFGKYIYYLPETESTNTYGLRLAQEGAPEGTVILTDFQKAGRGRQNNNWESSKESNILMSVILRPRLKIERVVRITLATSDIIISSLENILEKTSHNPIQFSVKWPNDILANEKKLGGVLTESSLRDKEVIYVVVGIGININQDLSELSEETREIATSLRHETNTLFERENIIVQIISLFEKKYLNLERNGYSNVAADWKRYCNCLGRAIEIKTYAGVERGKFMDINDDGALIFSSEKGQVKELISGSIRYI
jgi:BirA family biotin operon repressor/biotin-[acetyl-CoA-carboxylase] ligase